MKILQKWNYELKRCEYYKVPNGNYKILGTDMNEIIKCPHCLRRFRLGTGYTSKVIRNNMGFGYIICPECYKKEIKEEYLYYRDQYKWKNH